QEQHVTVIRAKEEKVAALENRAKEGLKRLKDAHDSALREQAARATASEKEAREELKKFKELHELTIAEMAPLRTHVAELRAQVEKNDELRRDIDALSQQVGQSVGARDKLRRELDEARSLLDHTRDELKNTQDHRDESERTSATLRIQITNLERKLKEEPKEDPRISGLQKELAGLRDELKKAQDLRATSERDGAGLRTQVAGLQKDLAGLRDELKKAQDLRAASERDGVGLRTQIAGLQKDLAALREELKKAQDLRGASDRDSMAFKARVAGLQKEVSSLRDELKKAQDLRGVTDRDNTALKAQVAEFERRTREGSREDPHATALQKDLAAMKARAEKSEAKSAEAARYFESMEKQLIEARDEADKAESLRGELEKMKEACREHEEGLDQLSETVMELQHQLDSAAEAIPPPKAAPPPTAEKHMVLEPEASKLPVATAPPPSPPPPAPKAEPMKIEIDVDLEAPLSPPPPPPAPKPVVLPPAVAVPNASSAETTLRSNNMFGPIGPDGQPIYLLHEMLPKDAKGVVYRATERAGGRAFAVRFMGGQAGEEQTRAFEKEVEKLISLPHPNILHVQGTGRRKNRLYVMMDLVDAPALGAAKIQEIPRICAILRDAAAAVHYAHEEGIFHGDLNLETILVGKEEGQDLALVKDFGLAYMLETQTAGL
ncbi:MAG TPA: protein kinase, partial [Planctomycetota bacterium]|nr:protein kinase [Planctomycetota bacterium]